MAQRAALPAELTRNAVALARALNVAVRGWGFYPPEHPAIALAVDRLTAACRDATAGGLLQLAVTPRTLFIDGVAVEAPDLTVAECAQLLHDRDVLQLGFVTTPPGPAVLALLEMLSLDRATRRERGGPAAIWLAEGDASILVEQIDYQEILERDADESAARRDSTWKAIVRSVISGRRTFSVEEQERLLEISRDPGAVGELAADCRGPFCTPDGAPLLTTQAATVLAVYRHVAATVAVLEPDRSTEVLGHLTLAAAELEPAVAFELLRQQDSDEDALAVMATLKKTFDDHQVALMLARALATPGHPTGRLAQVLDTLAPDEARRHRVLKLTERMLTEREFGSDRRPLQDIRASLEELLLRYDESAYVSAGYRESMDDAAGRAADLAGRDLPPELDEWLTTLGHEQVRRLSGILLTDLLRLETAPGRAAEIAQDMSAFVEDLVLAGAYTEATAVVEALGEATRRQPPVAPAACREAVERLGRTTALVEAVQGLAELDAAEVTAFGRLARAIGVSVVPALLAAHQREEGGAAADRASAIIVALGPPAIPALQAALDDRRWFVQREVARLLGGIGTAAAVAPLQVLLRRSDVRVLKAAVAGLARIDDPSAARALHTVLRAATGEAREAVIAALVGLQDPRVVPMLVRIVSDSDPLGDDHVVVLDALGAMAATRDDRAIPAVAAVARQRRLLAWKRTGQVRRAALMCLARIGSPKSTAAIGELARTGDWFLRRMARATPAHVETAG
ncbi:MAG: HEAT repeat domain-containing protein [Vicinamibacterales bacterium]